MRLLLVTQDFPPGEGGMARYYGDLAAGFDAGEIRVSTVAAQGAAAGPAAHLQLARLDFPLDRAHRPLELWRWERQLARLAADFRPTAIVCGNLRPLGPLCRRVAGRLGVPYDVVVHGNDLLATHRRWSGWRRGLWQRVLGDARRWVANSRAVQALGVAECGLPPERGAIVPPEVDTRRFRPPTSAEAAAARAAFGLPEGPLALFVGRLVERKGLDRLIGALARVPAGALAVAGYGDAAPYHALAVRHGVAGRVHFLGAVDDARLPALYQAADLVAMPSRTIAARGDLEGFGIVYLEAAASGRPALAGRSGGAPEAVLEGITGRVVDGDDEPGVAAALGRLLGDPAERARLGGAARARVEREFGPGSMARRYRSLPDESR